MLESHIKICLDINYTKWVTLYEIAYVGFQNFKTLLKALFIIYAEFEITLPPAADNKTEGPGTCYTKKYHYHIVSSYGCKLMCWCTT